MAKWLVLVVYRPSPSNLLWKGSLLGTSLVLLMTVTPTGSETKTVCHGKLAVCFAEFASHSNNIWKCLVPLQLGFLCSYQQWPKQIPNLAMQHWFSANSRKHQKAINPATRTSEPFSIGLPKQNISLLQSRSSQLQPTLIVWLGSNWLNKNTKQRGNINYSPAPQKIMVQRRTFPFGARPSFKGASY